jgi:hypothetical protein
MPVVKGTRHPVRTRSSSILGGIFAIFRQAKEHTDATSNAKAVFANGGTLQDVISAFSDTTNQKADDAAWSQIQEGLARLRSISHNAATTCEELSSFFYDIASLVDDLAYKPLKQVLDEKSDRSN